jgi:dienelactone hydrolase
LKKLDPLHFNIRSWPLWSFVFFFCVSCGGINSGNNSDIDSSLIQKSVIGDSIQTGKVITRVICSEDPSQSYALYIPKDSNNKPLPIIYFFDAHGDGALPVIKYKALADSFHFILAGSNNSKNGNDWNDAQNTWSVLNDDVQKRVAVDPARIYACGFSGGAKVATFLALHHNNISGVIANGAGLEDITTAGKLNFSFTAITGNGDLNMTDLVSIDKILDKNLSRHRIIFFNGIHEWAPESSMMTAFDGLKFDAMRNNLIPADSVFINRFDSLFRKKVKKDLNEKSFLEAAQECKLAYSMLDDVSDESAWFHKKEDSVSNTGLFKKQQQAHQQILQKEGNIKSVFQQHFQTIDPQYWNKTITEVKSKAKGNSPEAAMYKRLDAYLSLAFYSLSNQLINQNKNEPAEYFVDLYKKDDPSNSEAWYFSAILDARKNNAPKAEADLEKAIALGFNDKKRLEQQPEFTNSKVNLDLQKLESQMK